MVKYSKRQLIKCYRWQRRWHSITRGTKLLALLALSNAGAPGFLTFHLVFWIVDISHVTHYVHVPHPHPSARPEYPAAEEMGRQSLAGLDHRGASSESGH